MSELSSRLTADHWVSRGLQANFADDDKRVSILDTVRGIIIDPARPVKSNFVELGFTTFIREGVPSDLMERAFASVERSVLNEIRLVNVGRRGPEQKAAVANLFAIHLVRSASYKAFHREVAEGFRASGTREIAEDPRLREMFELSVGHSPSAAELTDLVLQQHDAMAADPLTLVQSMLDQHDQMAEKLNGLHMQVVVIEAGLPGFVLGDAPVVHADTRTGRYGFRDRLALGDANLIIGPLTRRTAACFSLRPLPPAILRTRRMVDRVNAVFIRAALSDVACHPDDARALRHTWSRLDRLPPPVS